MTGIFCTECGGSRFRTIIKGKRYYCRNLIKVNNKWQECGAIRYRKKDGTLQTEKRI